MTDFELDYPVNRSNYIKVIGVGGGGSNAVNHMNNLGIEGVDFVICNTDHQALDTSKVPNKIPLGQTITEGLGAGADPEIGEQAAVESQQAIEELLDQNTKMVFITAGMGGGTGTGAAPVIAKIAKEKGILTVGIVTIPFSFEGKTRQSQAMKGVDNLRKNVDSLIVINNNKLREVYGNLPMKSCYAKADEVLTTASRGIAEVITKHYITNVDLRDARTVLENSGTAIMGSATAEGEDRAQIAVREALDSPLLNNNKITGAKNVLLLIVSGKEEVTMDEVGEINEYIQNEAGNNANIIMGHGDDETLENKISVTVIATGFNIDQQNQMFDKSEPKKVIHHIVDNDQPVVQDLSEKEVVKLENAPLFANPSQSQPTEKPAEEKQETVTRKPIQSTGYSFQLSSGFSFQDTSAEKKKITEEEETIEEEDFVISKVTKSPSEMESVNTEEEAMETSNFSSYIKKEKELIQAKPYEESPKRETSDIDMVVIEKPIDRTNVVSPKKEEELSPLNSSFEEVLRARASERKATLKAFNHKFNERVSQYTSLEKEPAYKRMNINIDSEKNSEKGNSNYTIGSDKETLIRKNNSYLDTIAD